MSSHRAFYSVVQYCPDRFRAEGVNIGLVLFCEEPLFCGPESSTTTDGCEGLFGVSGKTLATLRLSEQNLLYRLNEQVKTSERWTTSRRSSPRAPTTCGSPNRDWPW